MNEEIWKDIEGYEGLYQISNLGNVRSVQHIVTISDPKRNRTYTKTFPEQFRKTCYDPKGYVQINLKKGKVNKRYRVHRLVALAFIPNPSNLPQVNHKDEDKSNNRVDNLEWCTNEYNSKYGTRLERISDKLTGKSTHNSISITIDGVEYESISKASQALGISTYKIKKLYGQ